MPLRRPFGSALVAAFVLLGPVVVPAAHADRAGSPQRALAHGFVSMGGSFSCVVGDDAAIRCWGNNINGELGSSYNSDQTDALGDDPNEMPGPTVEMGQGVRSIDVGGSHGCAVVDDATVRCWGGNGSGQLGVGDTQIRGNQPGELPTPPVPLGRPAVAVAAGLSHSCALLDDGTVHCWGENTGGALGLGDTARRGDSAGDLPTPAVPLPRPAVSVVALSRSTCALLDDYTVHCWGLNESGQLGVGDASPRGDGPGELPTPAVPLGRPAIALVGAVQHACALLDDGTIRCWGRNQFGQLGVGDKENRGDAPNELPTPAVALGRPAIALSAAGRHTCAQLDDGTVHCWGDNLNAQLGLGHKDDHGDTPGELPSAAVAFGQRVRRAVDLSLAAGASDAAREVGQQVTLTYTLANGGPNQVGGVQVGVGLPGMTIDSATASHGTFDPASETWRGVGLDSGGVAILTVVATVRSPGALAVSGEVTGADALDGDSTPANGAAEDDRAAATVTATTPGSAVPPPPAKGAIDALTLKGKVARDRRKPYAFSVTGAVIATRTALAGACRGTVTVNVTKGKTKITSAKGKLKLSKSAGTCTYRATIKLPSKAKAGSYTAVATFPGNAAVDPKTSKKLALRAG